MAKKERKVFPSDEFRNLRGPRRKELVAKRKEKGLTQAQLAELIGCNKSMISHLEAGRNNPSLEMAMQLTTIFESTLFELFPDL